MVNLDWLEELIKYTIVSTYVKDETPVSLLVIAEPETGKTKCLEKFANINSVLYATDFTRFGLTRDWWPKIQAGIYRTIIVPDMVQLVAGKGQHTAEGIIAFLNSITEEGLKSISTFGISLNADHPIKMAFIGAIPKSIYIDRRSTWRKMGFVSRTLPISYTHSKQTTAMILGYITKSQHTIEPEILLNLPTEPMSVELSETLAETMLPLSQALSGALEEKGYRLQRHLQVLAKARALSEQRLCVNEEDIMRIKELAAWINLDFKPI